MNKPVPIKSDEPMCPWCGEIFPSWALAKPHVKHCYKAPHKRTRHEPRMTPKIDRKQGNLFE
jgi:hypothetical protein